MSTTLIDVIRHGEPVGGRRYRGQIDDPLSDKGWQQMRNAVGDHAPWQHIVTSPLSRCSEFAQETAAKFSLPLINDSRLMEIGFGEWEGMTADEIEQATPGALADFYRDPVAYRPKGAESLTDFQQRVDAALNQLAADFADQRILVVAHAGVIRMMMLLALSLPQKSMYQIKVDNAHFTRLQADKTSSETATYWQLLAHGLPNLSR